MLWFFDIFCEISLLSFLVFLYLPSFYIYIIIKITILYNELFTFSTTFSTCVFPFIFNNCFRFFQNIGKPRTIFYSTQKICLLFYIIFLPSSLSPLSFLISSGHRFFSQGFFRDQPKAQEILRSSHHICFSSVQRWQWQKKEAAKAAPFLFILQYPGWHRR